MHVEEPQKEFKVQKKKEQPRCRYCKTGNESTYHMLSECEAHTATRWQIWGEERLSPPYNIKMSQLQEFLTTTQMPTFQDTLSYTVKTQRKKEDGAKVPRSKSNSKNKRRKKRNKRPKGQ